MTPELQKLFPELKPPPGGMEQLHSRLSARPRQAVPNRLVFAVIALLVIGLLVVWQPAGQQQELIRQNSPLWENAQIKTWLQPQPKDLLVYNEQQQPLPVTLVYRAEGIRIYETKPVTRGND